MARSSVFLNSAAFVLGFSLVFSLVGVLLQTVLSTVAYDTLNILRLVGGFLILLFGVFLIASLKYNIPFFQSEHKIKVRRLKNNCISSFLFGVAFSLGWTPCVGAILGSIYTLAATSPGAGFLLLLSYSLGIGLPFLIAGAFTSKVSRFVDKSSKILKYFTIIGGSLLVLIGLLIIFNYLGILASFLVGPEGPGGISGNLNFFLAFFAGILTFVSPCILPLLPAFFSYMAGTAAKEISERPKAAKK